MSDEDEEVNAKGNKRNSAKQCQMEVHEMQELKQGGEEAEDEEMQEIEQEEKRKPEGDVFIRESSKSNIGKRFREKFHCCYYCNKTYKELSKHLSRKHPNEADVAKLLAMPKNNTERRKGFIRLSRVGDYYHNIEVLKTKSGELILVRLPTPEEREKYSYRDYGPCPDCLGFMLKRHLWHHIKYSCVEGRKTSDNQRQRRKVISESTVLLTCLY